MDSKIIGSYRVFIYNADDEEPNCGQCIHFGGDIECSSLCGSRHSWGKYKREEFEKIDERK